MAGSMDEAFRKAGITRESLEITNRSPNPKRPAPQTQRSSRQEFPELFAKQMVAEGVTRLGPLNKAATSGHRTSSARPKARASVAPSTPDESVRSHGKSVKIRSQAASAFADLNRQLSSLSSVYSPNRWKPVTAAQRQLATASLEIVGDVAPNPLLMPDASSESTIIPLGHDGIASQLATVTTDEIDLTIGVDFGTSCVKAVIRDGVRRAFAVPFLASSAENPYLLPSRVFEFNERLALSGGGIAYRNLKLSLLRKDCTESEFETAAGFLAAVIRHCRGWLLANKADIYKHAHLNWSLNLSLPAATYEDESLVRRFHALALAAMNLAGAKGASLTRRDCREFCQVGWDELRRDAAAPADARVSVTADMVDVVPEIAAQIWGFVQSARFDPAADNRFLLVDVGGGTVDASIFHVKKEARGQTGFMFFANTVDHNGVMNLHRERIRWLGDAFAALGRNAEIENALTELSRPTDRLHGIPESIGEYFSGIKLNFTKVDSSPDAAFFRRRYWRQVFGQTLHAAKQTKLRDADLNPLPFFLTGGGSRLHFFGQIDEYINNNPHCTWAGLRRQSLELPAELNAPGLKRGEYDRLSVAYGLSFLKLGSYVRSRDVPNLEVQSARDYYDRFISKDQV